MKKYFLITLVSLLLSACALTDIVQAPPPTPSRVLNARTPVRPVPFPTQGEVIVPTFPPRATAAPSTSLPADTAVPTLTSPTPIASPTPRPTLSSDPLVAFAQQFDERAAQAALEYTRKLTSKEFEGRKAGAPGADKAADFIASIFKAAGLKPVGDNNTYFQNLSMPFIDLGEAPTLKLINANGRVRQFQFRQDFRESGSWLTTDGQAEGRLVFLGRGASRDMALANDLNNKIALLLPGPNVQVANLVSSLAAKGVTGILVVTSNPDSLKFKSSYILGSERQGETHPLLVINREVADELLKGSGATLQELEDRLNRDGAAYESTANQVSMSMRLAPVRDVNTKNVIGALPGSDPALSNEVVIIGGHYDGVGADPSGGLFYEAANDNASGPAVIMALVNHFVNTKVQPKRTIVFAAWTGEESGLVGSDYYVKHPIFPLNQTVGYINLDVVGAGTGEGLTITNDSPNLGSLARTSAAQLGVNTEGARIGGGSDHESFLRMKVPAVFFIWQNYGPIHVPEDTFDKIDANKLRITGQVTALTAIRLANQ